MASRRRYISKAETATARHRRIGGLPYSGSNAVHDVRAIIAFLNYIDTGRSRSAPQEGLSS
jgi:hypothetical protein